MTKHRDIHLLPYSPSDPRDPELGFLRSPRPPCTQFSSLCLNHLELFCTMMSRVVSFVGGAERGQDPSLQAQQAMETLRGVKLVD